MILNSNCFHNALGSCKLICLETASSVEEKEVMKVKQAPVWEKDQVRNARSKTEEEKVDRSPTAELCFQRVDAEE